MDIEIIENTTSNLPISNSHKLIFIHIAKNAGTSTEKSLNMKVSGHHPFSFYKDKYPSEWATYKKFAIIRNPWDRFVSSYEYSRMPESYWHSMKGRARYGPHPDYEKTRTMSIKDCAEALLKDRKFLKHHGWLSQLSYIHDGQQIVVDELIRFENIESEIFSKLGFTIPYMNKSKRSDYKSYYTQEAMHLVSELYKEDIKAFGYSF